MYEETVETIWKLRKQDSTPRKATKNASVIHFKRLYWPAYCRPAKIYVVSN